MEKQITCITCPVGCRMKVVLENEEVISVEGNTCPRGEKYARQECTAPVRMVTAVMPVAGAASPLSVKTRTAIPKKLIFDCLKQITETKVTAPVHAGTVIVPDVCGTGVDVIATKSVG